MELDFLRININNLNGTDLIKPLIPTIERALTEIVLPAAALLPLAGHTLTYTSTGVRTMKAFQEFKKGRCSLRNPKFWLRTFAAASTGSAAVFYTVHGFANMTGNPAKWALTAGATAESMGDTLDEKFTIKSILW